MEKLMSGIHFFDPQGILSLRENGYRDTASALSELLDNSIQAEAKNIDIIFVEKIVTRKVSTWNIKEVFIVDDGIGMDKKTTEACIRFGGGTRHGAKKGLGKFGFGLPNSSASQCPRFEVYSKKGNGNTYFSYFDFNEIFESKSDYLPEVEELNYFPDELKKFGINLNNNGTVVKWCDCDKLNYKTASRLVKHISKPLGRIFRHFINENKVNINIHVFQDNGNKVSKVNGDSYKLKPLDPLFLMTGTQLPTPFDKETTNEIWPDSSYRDFHSFTIEENLDNDEVINHEIKYRFSIKNDRNKQEGNTELGRIYRSVMGISVVRAGREIALDDFGFITTIDPRHRWWSVEVQFEPISDHLFGLDNSKQNVFNFKNISDDDAEDVLSNENSEIVYKLMHELSKRLSNGINQMYSEIKSKKPETIKPKEDNEEDRGEFPNELFPVPDSESDRNKEHTEEEYKEVADWILTRFPSYQNESKKLKLAVEWFFNNSPFNQYIIFREMGETDLFSFKPLDPKVIIEININHDFYQRFMLPIFESEDLTKIEPLLILFGSMAQTEIDMNRKDNALKFYRSRLGFNLNIHINKWTESQ